MFEKFYKNIYFLGLKSGYLLRDIFKWIAKKIAVPFKAIGTFFLAGFLLFDKKILEHFRNFDAEVKAFLKDFKSVQKNLKETYKTSHKAGKRLFQSYVKIALQRHLHVFKTLGNVVLPLFMLFLLLSTIGHFGSQILALEVKYNDAVIGYVESENVFHEAQSLAQNRLSAVARAEQQSNDKKGEDISFAVKSVRRSDLQDSSVLCDELLRRSNNKTTNACGIYINDDFLCAVKNETDATSVFDKILKNYKTDDKNDVVGFVENIDYVQGLYPDATEILWDAEKLSKQLNSKKKTAEYYTVKAGDTFSGIASNFDLKQAELRALNPQYNDTLHIGDQLLISREVSYIQVKVTKTEKRTVQTPFETEKVENKKMYSGQKRVKQKGQKGEELITELVTYVDGVRVSAKEIDREVLKKPIKEIIQVGTKKDSGYGGGGPIGPYDTTSYGGRFIWPAVGAYKISSPFGGRRHHGGVDIVKPGGKSAGCVVVAAGSGKVIRAGKHSSYGNYVVIDHGDGLHTLYAHMQNGSLQVRAGQHVSAGQALGRIGATGRAYGAHLHFEVRVNRGRTRVNPMPYLK